MSLNQQQTNTDVGAENKTRKKRIVYGKKAKRLVLSKINPPKPKKDNDSISGGCCVGVKRISTMSSCVASPTSDPNSPEFTFDSLRSLIESSDFLLNDCNTHFDFKDH
ncbi:hypothetical protein QVD17_12592 [Tagetes erecta]|uniref:Uncharacterized protein n=1 Tax=Tagetes erecta TaxID=13708 RepID=A0AAD8KZ50_TARER|nr:hypothetical protein QVD17_12592 [Tagetes erecta]